MKIVALSLLLISGCATDTEYFGGRLGPWVKDDLPSCMDVTLSMKRIGNPYANACVVN